jgi:hypothetical protein
MINAIRTALINRAAASSLSVTYPGYEYVPPEYKPKVLDEALESLRATLIGPDTADLAYLNYRVGHVLEIAHTCGFDKLLRNTDPRVTYARTLEERNTQWDAYNGKITRDVLYGQTPLGTDREQEWGHHFTVLGRHTSDETRGRVMGEWRIGVNGTFSVTVSGNGETVTYSGGKTTKVPLPGCTAAVRVLQSDDMLDVLDFEARFTAVARPQYELGTIAARLADNLMFPEILRRTPQGKEALQSFVPNGPLWSVIGPAVVGIGYAILASR